MNKSKLIIIIAVVLGLAVLALVKKSVDTKDRIEQQASEQASLATIMHDFDPALVQKIIIYNGTQPDNRLEIVKTAEKLWIIPKLYNMHARSDRMEGFLSFMKMIKGEVRSRDPALLKVFEIADDQAAHIILQKADGTQAGHLIISYSKPKWNKSFVREGESSAVYEVAKDVAAELAVGGRNSSNDGNAFAELAFLTFDPKDIRQLEITRDNKTFTFKRPEAAGSEPLKWNISPALAKDASFDSGHIDGVVGQLSGVRAYMLIGPVPDTYGFSKPRMRIRLVGKTAQEVYELEFAGAETPEKITYVRLASNGYIYKMSDMLLEDLDRLLDSLQLPGSQPNPPRRPRPH